MINNMSENVEKPSGKRMYSQASYAGNNAILGGTPDHQQRQQEYHHYSQQPQMHSGNGSHYQSSNQAAYAQPVPQSK